MKKLLIIFALLMCTQQTIQTMQAMEDSFFGFSDACELAETRRQTIQAAQATEDISTDEEGEGPEEFVRNKTLAAIENVIKQKIDPNLPLSEQEAIFSGIVPLHWTSMHDHYLGLTEQLLAGGATPDFTIKSTDNTPLGIATIYGATATLKLLLLAGADPNKTCEHYSGRKPLHAICLPYPSATFNPSMTQRMEIVQALLDRGALRDARDNQGETPIQFAQRNFPGSPLVTLLTRT